MSKANLAIFQQLSKFSIIGVVATIIHISTAELLIHLIIRNPFYANLIAFFLALSVSFFGHYHWSFSTQAHKGYAFMKFFITAFVAMLANNALLSVLLFLDLVGVDASIIIAALVVPFITFIMSRYWAFAS